MTARPTSAAHPIVLLTGAAGAGKSTLSELWARSCAGPAAVIDHDQVRDMIHNRSETVVHGWTPEVERTWLLARDACVAVARIYAESGIPVLIEAFASPDDEHLGLPAWRKLLSPHDVVPVVLLPRFATVESRNRARADRRRLDDATLRTNVEVAARWRSADAAAVIDNTLLTPEQTLEHMRRILTTE